MKGHKLAAKSQGYDIAYDRSLRTYRVTKEGFKTLHYSKLEFETMAVWKLVHKLQTNDMEEQNEKQILD